MKNIFKFILVIALTAVSLNAKTIIVGSDAEYPPFDYIDENGKIAGFDIDLIDEISKIAGFEYKFTKIGFDALIPALKAGKIDAIAASMSATPERKKSVDFSDPYFFTKNLYLKIATNKDIKRHEECKEIEKEAFKVCEEKIKEHGLDIVLTEVEYKFDNSKILFCFTSS